MLRHPLAWIRTVGAVALFPLAGLGCAHQPTKAQASSGAVAEAVGVRVAASDESARGSREDRGFTPIQISIDNHSGHTLRVAYPDFSLTDRAGAKYLPLLAIKNKGHEPRSLMSSAAYQQMRVYTPIAEPCGRQDRLVDAPYLTYSYTGPTSRGSIFPYASSADASWCADARPTPQMVTEALPEKPLPDGAHAEGFVYFQAQGDRAPPEQLTMNLVDAATGQPFGQLALRLAANQ